MKQILIFILIAAMLLCAGCTEQVRVETSAPTVSTTSPHSHEDKNDNGSCDGCGESVMTTFDLYAINDLHGKITDGDSHPGVDELTTYLKAAAATDDNVVLLSAGDMWQGAAESNLTYGLLVTDWMNQMGFSAMTVGNHEYDWGEKYVAANAEFAEFPLLAINVYDRATDARVDYCQGSALVELDGVQVGIIGAIGDCYSSIAPDKVEEIYFVTGSELTALVKAESEMLRSQGADFIVYSIHDGYGQSKSTAATSVSSSGLKSYYDVSLSDGWVDLVFEGHTHQQYLLQDEHGVYHLQNKGDNYGGISHVEVQVNTLTGTFSVSQAELVKTDAYSGLADDPIVEQLLEKYAEELAPAKRILGQNKMYRNSDYLRRLVADVYYNAGMEAWGDEYDIVLGGGFISVRSPYYLASGEVTYADLQSLLPFDNDLVLCSVRGRDLLPKFINTNNSNYAVSYGDNGKPSDIDPNGTYYIVVDTYTSAYPPNNLTVVETYEAGIYARDLLAEYIENGGLS